MRDSILCIPVACIPGIPVSLIFLISLKSLLSYSFLGKLVIPGISSSLCYKIVILSFLSLSGIPGIPDIPGILGIPSNLGIPVLPSIPDLHGIPDVRGTKVCLIISIPGIPVILV